MGLIAVRIHILTIFPQMFAGPFDESIVKRARQAGLVDIRIHDIRQYTHDRHHTVDDYPYGGGPGMVMKPEALFEAVEAVRSGPDTPVILLTPRGRTFVQREAERLATFSEVVLICGHYEGVDERVRQYLVTDELSIGDYVLTGGELPAMVVVDAVVRLLPGAMGHGAEAVSDDSHTSGLLQYPQYTRPAEYRGWRVPDVLLSGHHGEVERWRRQESLRLTLLRRPDLLERASLSPEDRRFLDSLRSQEEK